MTSFQIKLLAIFLMTIDHIGMVLFPEAMVFRLVGRLAFPLFAWQLAVGATHTQHPQKYLLRLLLFGLISQPIYSWVMDLIGGDVWTLNIFFTLAMGLAAIMGIRKFSRKWQQAAIVVAIVSMAVVLPVDYGVAGVLSILAFYFTLSDWRMMLIGQSVVFTLHSGWAWWQGWAAGLSSVALTQPVAPLSVLIVALYNGQPGPKATYLFYVYYPLHLLVLGLLYSYLH